MSGSRKHSLSGDGNGGMSGESSHINIMNTSIDNNSSNNSLGSACFGSGLTMPVHHTQPQQQHQQHLTPGPHHYQHQHQHHHPFTHSVSLNVNPSMIGTPVSPASSASPANFHHLQHHLSMQSSAQHHSMKPSSPISVILRQTSNSPVGVVNFPN